MLRYTLLAACFAATSAAAEQSIELIFTPELGGQAFSCAETYDGLGTTGAPMQVLDYRLFVSNVRLVAQDGTAVPLSLEQDGRWQVEDIALLDFEDASGSCTNGTTETNTIIRGTVPEGTYTGVTLDIGVPFEWNHGDPTLAASPLNLTAMFWNWRGGYKFIKFEMSPVMADGMNMAKADHSESAHGSHGGASGWFLHLGSTMCDSGSRTTAPETACANPNLMTVTLDSFDPATQTIVIDPAEVLSGADLTMNTPETSPGCMSFPNDADCTSVLPKLGLGFNDVAPESQVLVSAR